MKATVSTSKYRVIVDNVQAFSPVVLEIKKAVASSEWDSKLKVLYTALTDEETVRSIVDKFATPAKAVPVVADRVRVRSGQYKVGDTINGNKIISFGKTWSQFVADEDTSAYGLQPGESYNINLCYAYFN